MTDKPNGSVNTAALYAVIGQLTVENHALKAQIAQLIKLHQDEVAPPAKSKKPIEKAQEAH